MGLSESERANQAFWDEVAPVHSRAYAEVAMLRRGEPILHPHELAALGDVRGKSLLHLQCHIGTDTLSWARLGADVTGVDFSAVSLTIARELAAELGLAARFVHSNVYDLPQVLAGSFDIVYTSRGVLCWLKDLPAWARVIAHFLKPGGLFYLLEGHPFLNMIEESRPGVLELAYSYFHGPEPTCWDDESPDYADASYVPRSPTYEWSWTVSDILSALLGAGLRLESFHEFDALFYKAYPDMVPASHKTFIFPGAPGRLPLTFALTARKPAGDAH